MIKLHLFSRDSGKTAVLGPRDTLIGPRAVLMALGRQFFLSPYCIKHCFNFGLSILRHTEYIIYNRLLLSVFVSLFIQANAIRGVLAAVGCAVLFALVTVVYKFRWRANGDKVSFQIFSNIKSYDMKISQNFLKPPGAQIRPGERKSHLQQGGGRRERDRQPSDGQQIKLSFGILFFSMPQQELQEMISLICCIVRILPYTG